MDIRYEAIPAEQSFVVRDLCNELMQYQKQKAAIHPEFFDTMCFESRMLPSIASAKENYFVTASTGNDFVGYAYSNIASKTIYKGGFATLSCDSFFDLESVMGEYVGCLSQFYIQEGYRNVGIGSVLFQMSMDWLRTFETIDDIFIFVSNGNSNALQFYLNKGFRESHSILDGFITVLRN